VPGSGIGLGPREPDLHQQWLANIDPKDVGIVRAMLEECANSGTGEIEYRYRHPEHGPRWIYSKAGLVTHDSDRYVMGISLDVTERRQAEETLKEVNQRKDEFLAMLAHELRNPLAPIRNAAQILNVHASGKPQLEWVRAVIERQTRHLVRLVDDLLDVSRMVRGQIVLQKSPVELGEIVRHAVETSRPLIRMRKHRLDVKLPEQPVRLNADLTRMAQVLANLLNNAAKYTDEGGEIALEAKGDDREVTICVRDNGPGISAALLPQVFDMFTQADRTLDRAQGGLGIGLTLVKRLVEMHSGSVDARSEGLGEGAEFIVRLPIMTAEEAGDARRSAGESVPGARAPGLKILVVDDNVDAADSIAILLSMEGHQTQTVNNARDALIAATEFRPDVVLLDIGLPEMDGYEVARRLRSENAIENLRLVAVTGYGQPADRARAQAAGFDKHLVKPVEPAALNEFLRTVQSPHRPPS
jgi:signal transduction histidine kinase/ActR/RegA family two-component response regulator